MKTIITIILFLAIFVHSLGLSLYILSFITNPDVPQKIGDLLPEDFEENIDYSPWSPYTFNNKTMSLLLLSKLEPSFNNDTSLSAEKSKGKSFQLSRFMIRQNMNYCKKVLTQIVNKTHLAFGKPKYFTDSIKGSLLWNIIVQTGKNAISNAMGKKNPKNPNKKLKLQPHVQVYLVDEEIENKKLLERAYGCSFQMTSVLQRKKIFTRAITFQAIVEKYRKVSDDPKKNAFFPKTWFLENEKSCKDFFSNIQADENYNPQNYLQGRLVSIHVNETTLKRIIKFEEEKFLENLNKNYENGALCGKISNQTAIQKAIKPMLIYGRGFVIKSYLLLASLNPAILYFHKGWVYLSCELYNTNHISKNKYSKLSKLFYNNSFVIEDPSNFSQAEVENKMLWTSKRLGQYLQYMNKIQDSLWVDNFLYPEIKEASKTLWNIFRPELDKKSQFFQLLELSFTLDDKLNLWLVEVKPTIDLKPKSKYEYELLYRLTLEVVEIEIGLLRSKLKRLVQFLNLYSEGWDNVDDIKPGEMEILKDEYEILKKNKFETEFMVKDVNQFELLLQE